MPYNDDQQSPVSDYPERGRVWTVGELLRWTARDFQSRGIDTARLDAEILLARSMDAERVTLYARYNDAPAPDQVARFREAVKRRRLREPVAHIVGEKEFHDITLYTPPGRFVPRPETELLVDEAAALLSSGSLEGRVILDIGTGSGAIPLALLKAFPAIRAWAVDLDPAAGDTLMKSAERLGVSDRIDFAAGDAFEPVAGHGPFDMITSNPPYVPSGDIPGLMPEVRDHDPLLALDGGPDGLDFIRRLMRETPGHLISGGRLILEVGAGQARAVEEMASERLMHEFTRKDLAGIPRIVVFRAV